MPDPRSIQIGNQTSFSADRFLAPFEYALASGFDAFEWFPDKKAWGAGWDELDLTPELCAEIRKTARGTGMRLSVHARLGFNPLLPETFPLLQMDLRMASELGASVLVLHLDAEAGPAAFAKALLHSLKAADWGGIDIALENTVRTTPADFNQFFERLGELIPWGAEDGGKSAALARIGMCLDLGHANLCGATRNQYLEYIDQLDRRVPVIHLHLHENWGDADTHLTFFTGPAAQDAAGARGLVRRMKQRDYSGSIILEQWPQPPALLNRARGLLLELWQGHCPSQTDQEEK